MKEYKLQSVPLYTFVDEFETETNQIDDNYLDLTAIFGTLAKTKSPPERTLAMRALLMKSLIDTDADPCEDFYQYACGNWDKHFPIPKDKSENDVFAILNNNILLALKNLLTDPTSQEEVEKNYDAFDKAKLYYASCMNEKLRHKRGVSPLIDLLNEFGGWPVLNKNWRDEDFDWIALIARIAHLDLGIFITANVDVDLKDSSSNSIHINEANWGLESRSDYMVDGESLQAYQALIEEVLSFLNVSVDISKQTAKDIIEFETKLVKLSPISISHANFSDIVFSMSLEELIDMYPRIPWEKYLNLLFEEFINLNQTVVISTTPFFEMLPDVFEETSNKTIANYIGWRITFEFINYLDEHFAESYHKLDQALTGKQIAEPNWKKCVREVNEKMRMVVGAMFVRSHFDEKSTEDVEELTREIKQSFLESLQSMDWLESKTKQTAELKANFTAISVGYPDDIVNSEKLNNYYSDVHFEEHTYFENMINVAKNSVNQNNKKLLQVYDKNFWVMSPAVVNAYFEQTQNRIVVPAASLQPPLYSRYYPKFLNYAGMGYFVGHELTHGFDDVGREFNYAGNMVEWWDEISIKAFEEKTNCFTEQYGNYTMHGKSLEGFLSRGENIADNGGLRQAYNAYQKWLKAQKNSEDMRKEKLEGLALSNTKMFFLQFAQMWCGSIRPEAISNILNTDFHCPGKFRVIGTLSNFKEFSDEFQCPVGSKMNPKNKCRLW